MKKRIWIRIIAGALSLLFLAGCAVRPKTSVSPSPEPVPAATPAPTLVPAPSEGPVAEAFAWEGRELGYDGVHGDVDYADMAWYLYDMTEFDARADDLSAASDPAEAEALYRWLLDEYSRLNTLDELAWIRFYADGSEENSQACQDTDEMLTRAGDTLHAAIASALNGSAGQAFSEGVGEDVAESLSDYEEMTDREIQLLDRETELELAYNDLIVREDLSGPEMNFQAGEIFLELVAIRNELADIYGYDSFADYAYEAYYGRDYTPADAEALCREIRPYARRYYQNCCYCDAFYVDLGSAGRKTPEELIELLREYAPRISAESAEAERYMEDHGLYLLAGDIADLGFTTTLSYYNAPFLYNSLTGSIYDIQSCFHEFGHYCDAYINIPDNLLTSVGSYDIFEIHSTGLEALSYGWYGEIFGDKAEEARIWCLDGLMYNVITGCMFDEFQQYVYSHPDLTVEEVNNCWLRIMKDYGQEPWTQSNAYQWMFVSHNFESPFYYISYAASALASVQIWSRSQVDRDATIELYNRLVGMGAYDYGYCELLGNLGLHVFTDGVDGCLKDFYGDFEEMCLRYDRYGRAAA